MEICVASDGELGNVELMHALGFSPGLFAISANSYNESPFTAKKKKNFHQERVEMVQMLSIFGMRKKYAVINSFISLSFI